MIYVQAALLFRELGIELSRTSLDMSLLVRVLRKRWKPGISER